MFTCPSRELVSAYLDHETPDSWNKNFQNHLQNCSECAAVYEKYSFIHQAMQECGNDAELDYTKSFEKLMLKRSQVMQNKHNKKNWFYASVRVPIPLAAAAVLLFVFLPLGIFFKMENTIVLAKKSFTPILPAFIDRPGQNEYTALRSKDLPQFELPPQGVIPQAKIFFVGDFAPLYSDHKETAVLSPGTKIHITGFPPFATETAALHTNERRKNSKE